MTKRIGLSGGIGSGKSTVTRILEELGATTVDADAIVHELQAPGAPLLEAIAEAFGASVIRSDGSLDRIALGEIVFQDPKARARLGSLMHPPVIAEMVARAEQAVARQVPAVVLDIPLFFEGQKAGTGTASAMPYDATVLVWVPQAMQIQRTVSRDGCTAEEAKRRIAAQMPIDEKRALATHIIDNSGDLDSTHSQVEALWRDWTEETET
ncbi:MAG: dephospho-CoA kinase [Myxococcota bacterium]|nr:dephospho-CoA kinase [Myxococcota bacterium]